VTGSLWFWSASLANLAGIVLCGWAGIRAVRGGDVRTHRACMATCAMLVGAFLAAYAAKVALIGREDRSAWTRLDYAVLYAHELCIAAMLGAGALALWRAWRFRRALAPGPSLPSVPLPGGAQHRLFGRVAAWSGLFAFVTAIGVWAGMWARS
jgi:uncharacterized membrane protein YozB (DUF420 family)